MPRVERRAFLALCAAALGVAGCTRPGPDPQPAPTTSPPPADPDARLRQASAASELALITAYRAAIAEHPDLAADLGPFLAHHEAHLERVLPGSAVATTPPGPTGSPAAGGSAGPTGSANPTGSPEPGASSVERPDPAATLAALAEAEARARRERTSACDAATDPALARDLCLIAASEAQHADVLATLAESGSAAAR
jgi:hypothetical protein